MTVSIVVPVYNVEEYLPKCLDSILIDNHFRDEVICVNDGSTDGSPFVLEQYAKKYHNIRIIAQPNKGLSEARNTGLKNATGDYVFFVDSDDWIFPDELHSLIDHIDGEDVLYFNSKSYQEDIQQFIKPFDIAEFKHIDGRSYFVAACMEQRHTSFVCVWGGVYNRRFLIDNELWNEPGIYHEDNYFTPQVLLKAKIVSCLNQYLYAYRIRTGGSITAYCKPKHIKDLLFIARHLYIQFKGIKDIEPTFFYYIADIYTNLICRAYDNQLSLRKWWNILDGVRYYSCQGNSRIRKSAILSIISPYLSYLYLTDRLPSFFRRFVNKYF